MFQVHEKKGDFMKRGDEQKWNTPVLEAKQKVGWNESEVRQRKRETNRSQIQSEEKMGGDNNVEIYSQVEVEQVKTVNILYEFFLQNSRRKHRLCWCWKSWQRSFLFIIRTASQSLDFSNFSLQSRLNYSPTSQIIGILKSQNRKGIPWMSVSGFNEMTSVGEIWGCVVLHLRNVTSDRAIKYSMLCARGKVSKNSNFWEYLRSTVITLQQTW